MSSFYVPITSAVWREFANDLRLRNFFDAELNRERTRWAIWQSATNRGEDVGEWSGLDCEQILQAAKTVMSTADDFADTPHGRLLGTMRDLGEDAMKLNIIVSQVRAAMTRSFDGELRRIDKLVKDAEALLVAAKVHVDDAQMAVDDGYAAGEAAVAVTPTPLMRVVA
jgi:hypothetical protein